MVTTIMINISKVPPFGEAPIKTTEQKETDQEYMEKVTWRCRTDFWKWYITQSDSCVKNGFPSQILHVSTH